jgi:hypothetical protein
MLDTEDIERERERAGRDRQKEREIAEPSSSSQFVLEDFKCKLVRAC